MMQKKIDEANRFLAQLQSQIASDEIQDLIQHEKTLEGLSICMKEILSMPESEKSAHKEAFISLAANVETCLSKLKVVRDDSRSSMQKLLNNLKANQSYGGK